MGTRNWATFSAGNVHHSHPHAAAHPMPPPMPSPPPMPPPIPWFMPPPWPWPFWPPRPPRPPIFWAKHRHSGKGVGQLHVERLLGLVLDRDLGFGRVLGHECRLRSFWTSIAANSSTVSPAGAASRALLPCDVPPKRARSGEATSVANSAARRHDLIEWVTARLPSSRFSVPHARANPSRIIPSAGKSQRSSPGVRWRVARERLLRFASPRLAVRENGHRFAGFRGRSARSLQPFSGA